MRRLKRVNALIKNERGQVCHRINDITQTALGRNETLDETKAYIIENYKDYKVEFVLK